MKGCPLCGAREVGRIGRERYYCRECCHEWTRGDGEVKIYQVMLDGSVEQLETDDFLNKFSECVSRRRAG
jgi:ribosomal protein L37AE/L43A